MPENLPFNPDEVLSSQDHVGEITEEEIDAESSDQERLESSSNMTALLIKLFKKFKHLDPSITLEEMTTSFLGKFRTELSKISGSSALNNITTNQIDCFGLTIGENGADFTFVVIVGGRKQTRRCHLNLVEITHNEVKTTGYAWHISAIPKNLLRGLAENKTPKH